MEYHNDHGVVFSLLPLLPLRMSGGLVSFLGAYRTYKKPLFLFLEIELYKEIDTE